MLTRGRRALLWAFAGVVLLLLLAWLVLPLWLRGLAEQQGSAALGREVRIDALRFNPLTLTMTIEGLTIAGAAPADRPLLRLPLAVVNADIRSLVRFAPVVEAVDLRGLELNVARLSDGRYDLDDVLARLRPQAPASVDASPARFAVYNLRLHDGRIRFDDRPKGKVHEVRALALGLPFLSNLDDALDAQVEPRLAFELGNARFDTGAQARPFAQERTGVLMLKTGDIDLADWLVYLPSGLPVRPEGGRVSVDLAMHFKAPVGTAPEVTVKGSMQAAELRVVDADGGPLAGLGRLAVDIEELQPLQRRAALKSIVVDRLALSASRDAEGRVNWLQAFAPRAQDPTPPPAGKTSEWALSVSRLALKAGVLHWRDQAVEPAAALTLDQVALQLDGVRWPLAPAAPAASLRAQAQLVQPAAAASAPPAGIRLQGEWTAEGGRLHTQLTALPMAPAAPYLAALLKPRLEGQLALEATARWAGAPGTQPPTLEISNVQLDALKASMPGERQPVGSWKQLRILGVTIDPAKRTVNAARIELNQPVLRARRAPDGLVDVQQWLRAPTADAPERNNAPWALGLAEAAIDGGRLAWHDAGLPQAVSFELQQLDVKARGLRWPSDAASGSMLQGSVRMLAPGGGAPGELSWRGQLGLASPEWRGQVKAQHLPVHVFAGYAVSSLPLSLGRAEVGWAGEVAAHWSPEGLELDMKGDARVDDLRLFARQAAGQRDGDELLAWRSLELPGVQVAVAPSRKPRVVLGQARLSDFYARLSIDENGQFNLSGLNAPAPASSAAAGVSAPAPVRALAAVPAASEAALDLSVAGLELQQGRVDFADRFIRPNYSADLSDLNGRIGAFRTGTRDMAALDLRGRIAGTGLLEVRGSLNPTAQPLALDVQARASELELAPLSPYAGKYAGHAIERGKLSMDVAYRIDPDGHLDARNRIVLNQLTFGERIDSPQATKLPVLLAVALLKDGQGVIDLDLPIGGSINDPAFSIGGVVAKVIINVLSKALTAPFALLAGGGDHDLSVVEFLPGSTQPAAGAAEVIDKVARALAERPALQLTVTGSADPEIERQAIQAAWLDQRLAAEWRKERLRGSQPADAPASIPAAGWAPDERVRLVRRLYADTPLPDKPRNLLGLAKDIAPDAMEALLRGSHMVSNDNVRELALQRGLAVRDALIAKGLPPERLFLAAPQTRTTGDGAPWTPRVQLGLGTP